MHLAGRDGREKSSNYLAQERDRLAEAREAFEVIEELQAWWGETLSLRLADKRGWLLTKSKAYTFCVKTLNGWAEKGGPTLGRPRSQTLFVDRSQSDFQFWELEVGL